MSAELSNYLVPMLNASSIFGRILPGILADHIGRFNVIIATSIISTILVLGLWLPSTGNVPTIIFSVAFGFASGAYVSMGPALVAQISDIRQIGVRSGTLFAFVAFGALLGSPIGGALVTADEGKFQNLIIFAGVIMGGGAMSFIASRYVQAGFAWKKI